VIAGEIDQYPVIAGEIDLYPVIAGEIDQYPAGEIAWFVHFTVAVCCSTDLLNE